MPKGYSSENVYIFGAFGPCSDWERFHRPADEKWCVASVLNDIVLMQHSISAMISVIAIMLVDGLTSFEFELCKIMSAISSIFEFFLCMFTSWGVCSHSSLKKYIYPNVIMTTFIHQFFFKSYIPFILNGE